MQREKIQNKLQDHFETLYTEIVQYWINEEATTCLSEDKGGSHSFILLYKNIGGALKLKVSS